MQIVTGGAARRRSPFWRRQIHSGFQALLALGDLLTRVALVVTVLLAIPGLALMVGNRLAGYEADVVLSGSMGKAMPIGSLVIGRPVPATTVRVGDIITFHPPQESGISVSHRVVAIVVEAINPSSAPQQLLVTKGDANSAPDRWRVPVGGNIRRIEVVVPVAGYWLAPLQTPRLRIALIVVPVVLLLVILLNEHLRANDVDDPGELAA